MAQQNIDIGTSAGDGNGDTLRTAFDKINDNFTELYSGNVQITAANVLVYSVNGQVGNSAVLNFRFDIASVSVTDAGIYSAIPSNPVALTPSSKSGTAANVNVTWTVTQVAVTAGGDQLYSAASVNFETGAATATATVSEGNISAVTVTAGGSYSAVPNVSISGSTSKEYAAVIFDNTVRTFTNNRTYDWKFEGIPLTAPGQATIQSD